MPAAHRVRRFAALTLTLLIVLPLSVLAAHWQWNRHLEREARNQLITTAEQTPAAPLLKLLDQGNVAASLDWRQVSLQGQFVDDQPRLWRKQPFDGQPGFIGLARFRTDAGQMVLVELGWLPAEGAQPQTSPPVIDTGSSRSLGGYLRVPAECSGSDPQDLPFGQTNCPNTMIDSTMVQGMVQLQSPPAPWTDLGLPELDAGPHLGYVGQWILIGLTAIITYVSLVRRLGELPVKQAR